MGHDVWNIFLEFYKLHYRVKTAATETKTGAFLKSTASKLTMELE